jgi:hypothetical protein
LESLGPFPNDSPLHPDVASDGGNASALRKEQDDERPLHVVVGDAVATRPVLEFAAFRVAQVDSNRGSRHHAADLS